MVERLTNITIPQSSTQLNGYVGEADFQIYTVALKCTTFEYFLNHSVHYTLKLRLETPCLTRTVHLTSTHQTVTHTPSEDVND